MRQNPVATVIDWKEMLWRSIDFDNKEGFKKDVMHWLLIQLHNMNALPLVCRFVRLHEAEVRWLSLLRKAYYSMADNKECKGDVAPHAHYIKYFILQHFQKYVMRWPRIHWRRRWGRNMQLPECFRNQELGATKRNLKKYVIPIYWPWQQMLQHFQKYVMRRLLIQFHHVNTSIWC